MNGMPNVMLHLTLPASTCMPVLCPVSNHPVPYFHVSCFSVVTSGQSPLIGNQKG